MKNVHLCYEGGKREYFSPEAILNAAIIEGGKICFRHEGESQGTMLFDVIKSTYERG